MRRHAEIAPGTAEILPEAAAAGPADYLVDRSVVPQFARRAMADALRALRRLRS
jgi:hypothetical protein